MWKYNQAIELMDCGRLKKRLAHFNVNTSKPWNKSYVAGNSRLDLCVVVKNEVLTYSGAQLRQITASKIHHSEIPPWMISTTTDDEL